MIAYCEIEYTYNCVIEYTYNLSMIAYREIRDRFRKIEYIYNLSMMHIVMIILKNSFGLIDVWNKRMPIELISRNIKIELRDKCIA
jgi:hypothetical protein